MNWYEKLSEYFPIEEMKSKEHMEALLKEQNDIYHKEEGRHHVLMYAEFDSFMLFSFMNISPFGKIRTFCYYMPDVLFCI